MVDSKVDINKVYYVHPRCVGRSFHRKEGGGTLNGIGYKCLFLTYYAGNV